MTFNNHTFWILLQKIKIRTLIFIFSYQKKSEIPTSHFPHQKSTSQYLSIQLTKKGLSTPIPSLAETEAHFLWKRPVTQFTHCLTGHRRGDGTGTRVPPTWIHDTVLNRILGGGEEG